MMRIVVILAIVITLLVYLFWKSSQTPSIATLTSGVPSPSPAPSLAASGPKPRISPTAPSRPNSVEAAIALAFRTPIVFYGKVVDDKNRPVSDASVSAEATGAEDTFDES